MVSEPGFGSPDGLGLNQSNFRGLVHCLLARGWGFGLSWGTGLVDAVAQGQPEGGEDVGVAQVNAEEVLGGFDPVAH